MCFHWIITADQAADQGTSTKSAEDWQPFAFV